MILLLGKARGHRAPTLGCRGTESPGWFYVLPKKLCSRCDAWVDALWWSCQSPVVHSCRLLIIWIVSTEEYSNLMRNLMHICCSTGSFILNVMTTQYTCSLNGIYCPHWPVQWSHHCSHVHIPIHSPWLPGYIDVVQTILILTMAVLFLDRPCITILELYFSWISLKEETKLFLWTYLAWKLVESPLQQF